MITTDLSSLFKKHAILVLGTDKKVKDCNADFLKAFHISEIVSGADIDTLFDMQGRDFFSCHLAFQPFKCIFKATGQPASGWLIGGADGYRMIFETKQESPADSSFDHGYKRLEMLFDSMQEGVALCALIRENNDITDYIIEKVNAGFEAILPFRATRVQGRRASVVFGGKAPFLKEISKAVLSGKAARFEHYVQDYSRYLWVSVTSVDSARFAIVVSDMSQSIHMQLLQKMLNEAANHMSYALEISEIFEATAGVLRREGYACMLLLLDEQAAIRHTYQSFAQDKCRDEDVMALGQTLHAAVTGRRTVFLDNLGISADKLAHTGLHGAVKCIAAPLVVSDTFYGIFVLLSPVLRQYAMEPVTAFVNLMAAMIDRCLLVQQLKEHVEDLEQSKKAQDEMAHRLKIASTASHIGSWDYDHTRNNMYLDDTLLRIYGISDDFDGSFEAWADVLHPDDRINVLAAFNKTLRTGEDFAAEFRVIWPDGSKHYVRVIGILYRSDSGEPEHLVGTAWDITDRKMMEKALRESEAQLRRIFNLLPVGLCVVGKDGKLQKGNPAGRRMWGSHRVPKSLSESRVKVKRYPSGDDVRDKDWALYRTLKYGKAVSGELLEVETMDGQTKIICSDTVPLIDEDGALQACIMMSQDITENEKAKAALLEEKELLSTTLKSIGEGVVVTDADGCITLVNTAFEQLSGYTQDMLYGQRFADMVPSYWAQDKSKADLIVDTLSKGARVRRSSGILMTCRDGKQKSIAHNVAPIRNAAGDVIGAVLVMRDVTEEIKKQKKIDYLVYHDTLTGVYNRRYWEQVVKKIDKEENLPISIISCDVNGLKLTNDAFGHNAGDTLLVHMASVLVKACRSGDIVVRSGGDEFMILMPRADENEASRVCREIKRQSGKNRLYDVDYSISVGYETKKHASESLQSVICKAEAYMYRNKSFESPYMRGSSINKILNTLHEKNMRERIHCCHVSELCVQLAAKLGLSEKEIGEARVVGRMHDIGKIAINKQIMYTADKLSEEEWIDMKRHPEVGFRILAASTDTAHLAKSVLAHHERFDGSGYPNGLSGEDIPLLARILAVADAYEAMTNERPYRKIKTSMQALDEIARCSGSQFDPYIADTFIKIHG